MPARQDLVFLFLNKKSLARVETAWNFAPNAHANFTVHPMGAKDYTNNGLRGRNVCLGQQMVIQNKKLVGKRTTPLPEECVEPDKSGLGNI